MQSLRSWQTRQALSGLPALAPPAIAALPWYSIQLLLWDPGRGKGLRSFAWPACSAAAASPVQNSRRRRPPSNVFRSLIIIAHPCLDGLIVLDPVLKFITGVHGDLSAKRIF